MTSVTQCMFKSCQIRLMKHLTSLTAGRGLNKITHLVESIQSNVIQASSFTVILFKKNKLMTQYQVTNGFSSKSYFLSLLIFIYQKNQFKTQIIFHIQATYYKFITEHITAFPSDYSFNICLCAAYYLYSR